jgi:uncharacterized protein YfdQ (DUF2303 family)
MTATTPGPADHIYANSDEAATDRQGVKVAVDAAVAATAPHRLPDSGRHVIVTPPGSTAVVLDVDSTFEKHAPYPRRRRGTFTTTNPESLADYINRHQDLDRTEVWANVDSGKIVAVLNGHEKADGPVSEDGYDAGWGDHRAEFETVLTPEWKTWVARDDMSFNQLDFAEFIEDNLPDIVDPEPATLLEMAQTFDSTGNVVFRSQNRLATGERELIYKEEVDANAGVDGRLTIPETFTVALQPFEGAQKYRVVARLRFSIREGRLTLKYKLERPRDVLKAAFEDVIDSVGTLLDEKHGVPIFRGVPAGPQTPMERR